MTRIREAVDNLVVGEGPAGAMLAMRLADAGLNVTVLERPRLTTRYAGSFSDPYRPFFLPDFPGFCFSPGR